MHRRAKVAEDAAFQLADRGGENLEILPAGPAQRGEIDRRVLVDDIRAERHVHGVGDAQAVGGVQQAVLRGSAKRSSSAISRPSASPMPSPSRAPARMARFISRPVSSAMPNEPFSRLEATSSLVLPCRAISKSWMVAAPLLARWVITPRSIRSISSGASPRLTTCAPIIQITGRPALRASAIRCGHFLQVWRVRIPAPARPGRTRFSSATRLWRSGSG